MLTQVADTPVCGVQRGVRPPDRHIPLVLASALWYPEGGATRRLQGRVHGANPPSNSRWDQRALPTETQVESGTCQRRRGTSVNLSNSGVRSIF